MNSRRPDGMQNILARNGVFIPMSVFLVIAMIAISAFAYIRHNGCVQGSITVNGSTAFAPLLSDAAQQYEHMCSLATIFVNANPARLPGGSLNGLAEVAQGQADIGSSDVFMGTTNAPSYAGLEDHQIAVVIFALVVNSNVDIHGMSSGQIQGIYGGEYTNWKDVGSSENLDIVRVSRPVTSGTRSTFQKYILGGIETVSGPQSLTTDTTETVAKYISQQNGAIGYVSLYYARKYHLTTLSIDGKNPTDVSLVKDGEYKFWNIEHLYTKGSAQGLAQAFIDYMYSDAVKQIAIEDGYLNIGDVSSSVLANHEAQA